MYIDQKGSLLHPSAESNVRTGPLTGDWTVAVRAGRRGKMQANPSH